MTTGGKLLVAWQRVAPGAVVISASTMLPFFGGKPGSSHFEKPCIKGFLKLPNQVKHCQMISQLKD